MGNRSDILNDGDFKSDGLHGADRGFTAGSGTLDANLDFLEPVSHGLTAGILGNHLGGIGRTLTGAFESHLPGAGPADHRTAQVGDTDDGVVKGGLDMSDALGDVLAALGLDDLGRLDGIIEIEADRSSRLCCLLGLLFLALFGSLRLFSLGYRCCCLGRGGNRFECGRIGIFLLLGTLPPGRGLSDWSSAPLVLVFLLT